VAEGGGSEVELGSLDASSPEEFMVSPYWRTLHSYVTNCDKNTETENIS